MVKKLGNICPFEVKNEIATMRIDFSKV